ncbi:DNA replication helicase/nuclease 2 [Arctopsyche grandis]|uniref:DNA replication helicase/nuclease 2 n=1 Tax=Arctopsyche grandis TaxID=121162 RepID=UPI00406D99E4
MNKLKTKSQPKSQTTLTSYFSKPNTLKLLSTNAIEDQLEIALDGESKENSPSPKKLTPTLHDNSPKCSQRYVNNISQQSPLEQNIDFGHFHSNTTSRKVKLNDEDFTISSSPKKPKQFDSKSDKMPLQCVDNFKSSDNILEYDTSGVFDDLFDSNVEEKCVSLNSNMDNIFDDQIDEAFVDNWDMNDTLIEDLDISQWQRCIVVNAYKSHAETVLKLKSIENEKFGTCIIKDFWKDVYIETDNVVSIISIKHNDGQYYVTNQGGYLVLWPDNLITGTEIVNSLFCTRKSILQSNFKGMDSGNKSMVIGTLVHELLQICLRNKINTLEGISTECKRMLKDPQFIYTLYDIDMTETDASIELRKFIPQILRFIETYVNPKAVTQLNHKDKNKKWQGTIKEIVDIEENIWSPKYGVSGRIDVTVKVAIHNRRGIGSKIEKLMPLELKTGKASNSAEHRGQVILYTMLMTEVLKGSDVNEGLLLYLRDSIDVQEVSANYSEKRDLILLRNKLSHFTEQWRKSTLLPADAIDHNTKNVVLPDPINHHSACKSCPYLTLCSLYLSKDSDAQLSGGHLLMKLKDEAIGHLASEDVNYFLNWCRLLMIEDSEKFDGLQRKDIWNLTPSERERKGKCISGLVILSVSSNDTRFEHTFKRLESSVTRENRVSSLQSGDYVVISSCDKYGESSGTITGLDSDTVSVLLNRDLTKRNSHATVYTIDCLESKMLLTYNLTNLSVLMDNSDISNKLRRIIVNKQPSAFNEKLSSKIVEKAKNILSELNIVQQRAVLKSLTAKDYILIRGMPGTGKTQTLVALVKLLVKLDMSILITCQTHSAVDNIFIKLKNSNIKMLRLGASNKIHKTLQRYTETELTKGCDSVDALKMLYNSINVVGVTCLGSNHSLLSKRVFDVCIVDESTQVLQCSVLRPLFAAKKFILVGDPAQLPPIVRSSKARILGLDESLFSRLDGLNSTVSLTLQYRMNETITEVANRLTYNGQLKCANENVSNYTINLNPQICMKQKVNAFLSECFSTAIEDSVVFLDTGNTYSSCKNKEMHSLYSFDNLDAAKYNNICEALIVLNIIQVLLKASIKKNQIGVIAPYREQISLLNKVVKSRTKNVPSVNNSNDENNNDIEIQTVDQYQGRDKDIIIYSCTKTYSEEKLLDANAFKENQILDDKRRLTVAITRAKCKLIIIGDVKSLRSYKPFKELFDIPLSKKPIGKFISIPELMKNKKFSWETLDIF